MFFGGQWRCGKCIDVTSRNELFKNGVKTVRINIKTFVLNISLIQVLEIWQKFFLTGESLNWTPCQRYGTASVVQIGTITL